MMTPELLEPAIQRIGRILSERTKEGAPRLFDHRWWNELMLEWGMHDEAFKVQLFRFVDVLPTLKSDTQFMRVFSEYFEHTPVLNAPLRASLQLCSSTGITAAVGAKMLRRQFLRMARNFMVGENIQDALPVLERFWSHRIASSVDLLGEATVSEQEADQYRDRCLDTLERFHEQAKQWPANPLLEEDHLGRIPRAHLSIKISALYSQLEPADPAGSYHEVAKRLRPILDLAMKLPAGITVDMEQAEMKDLLVSIFMRIFSEPAYRTFPHGGIALQAYLRDATTTFNDLLGWAKSRRTPFAIRLVKGAYWDSETVLHEQKGWPVPVLEDKAETDAQYERLSRSILEQAHLIRPAFGTHNLRSLTHAEAAAQAKGLPSHAYEFQMLYGMAESLQQAVVGYGRRLRLYAPVGQLVPGMAYLVRRLLENTSNESFIRKQRHADEPLTHLLAPPTTTHEKPSSEAEKSTSRKLTAFIDFHNEPHADFSRRSVREAMQDALHAVRAKCGRTITYPYSAHLPPPEVMLSPRNPSRPQEIVATIPSYKPENVTPIVETARRYELTWSHVPPDERASLLLTAADRMRKQRYTLAAWEVFETGKPWREADADVAEAIDFLSFYAREMKELARPCRLGHEPGELNHLVWKPRGLTAVISPWNFPLAIPTGMVSAALVTGNVVVFKPSERSLVMGYHLYRILLESGIPQDALYFLPGGPDVGKVLADHPAVHTIAFTGSKAVGLALLQGAAHLKPAQTHVKQVIAEMGGKNAIIIDDTADLDEAVTGVLSSMSGYQGQKCSACSRAIVLESIHDQFVERLIQAANSLPIGPPEVPLYRMGPMIDERALAKVREYVDIGKQEGRLVLDRQITGDGWFQGPVIFTGINSAHRLAQEEIFGPVLSVMKCATMAEALQIANQTAYALTGGIYSRTPSHIQMAREQFDVGNLYINRPITGALVSRQPFGGHRLSGMGKKAGGKGYLTQFMVPCVVSENTLRRGFAPAQ